MTYLDDDLLDEAGQAGINKVGNDTDALRLSSVKRSLHKSSHVLLEHSLDVTSILLVRREDGLATKKTALLGAVPVELDGVVGLARNDILGLEEGAESFENGHGATAIVIGTWCGENGRQPQVDRILVRTDDDGAIRLARDGNNDRALLPGVGEGLGIDMLVSAGVLDDGIQLSQKPFGRLAAVVGLEVAGVKARELLQVGLDLLLVKVLDERLNLVLEATLLGEDALLRLGVEAICAELLVVGDIEEAVSVLQDVTSALPASKSSGDEGIILCEAPTSPPQSPSECCLGRVRSGTSRARSRRDTAGHG